MLYLGFVVEDLEGDGSSFYMYIHKAKCVIWLPVRRIAVLVAKLFGFGSGPTHNEFNATLGLKDLQVVVMPTKVKIDLFKIYLS